MWDETAKDNRQTAALISHDLTRNTELAFSFMKNLQFYCFQILKFFVFDFGFSRIDMNDILTEKRWAMVNQEDRISRSDTARQRVWELEKMSQSQAKFLCVCFTCSSKGHASWLWLVIFDPYIFVAEKPLSVTRNFTIHNLHSLLGQFGSFWTDGIKWLVLVCGKK